MSETAAPDRRRDRENWLTFAGVALMIVGLLSGLAFALLEFLTGRAAPYLGILYIGFTGLLVLGFFMIPLGILRARRRRLAGQAAVPLVEFQLDLTNPVHRYTAMGVLAGALMVLLLSAVGAYRAYQASESISFCGELCHSVMHPEWVTYHNSAHARVKCVECHIGPGADWYVRSKLSGLRQVWATAFETFPRPIPTPIHDLRPARETCEECHWRRKFMAYKEELRSYFLADEENTIHRLRMLVEIGGEKTTPGRGSGIHYHMLIARSLEYRASDPRRQEIAWIRVTQADGSVTEYRNSDLALSDEKLNELELRTMDCVDCHNRPSHQFPTPIKSVNNALEERTIPPSLPEIKLRAVIALDGGYTTTAEAMIGIADSLRTFYEEEYPEVIDAKEAELARAIQETKRIYRSTIFPEMGADWSVHPDNIGHLNSPGCFRCHNDVMESSEGDMEFRCGGSCHVILAQGEDIDRINVSIGEGKEFVHPEDYAEISEYEDCTECHTGGAELYE